MALHNLHSVFFIVKMNCVFVLAPLIKLKTKKRSEESELYRGSKSNLKKKWKKKKNGIFKEKGDAKFVILRSQILINTKCIFETQLVTKGAHGSIDRADGSGFDHLSY